MPDNIKELSCENLRQLLNATINNFGTASWTKDEEGVDCYGKSIMVLLDEVFDRVHRAEPAFVNDFSKSIDSIRVDDVVRINIWGIESPHGWFLQQRTTGQVIGRTYDFIKQLDEDGVLRYERTESFRNNGAVKKGN